MCQLSLFNMSTCTPLWSAQASAEGWKCLCCTSHIPSAELGFAVWQLREMQLHCFLPETSWKESGKGKSHAWETGVHETPSQGTGCCLPGTRKSCPGAQGKRTGSQAGVLLELLVRSVEWSETLKPLLTLQCWYFCLARGRYTGRAGDPGILEYIQK